MNDDLHTMANKEACIHNYMRKLEALHNKACTVRALSGKIMSLLKYIPSLVFTHMHCMGNTKRFHQNLKAHALDMKDDGETL